MIPQSKEGFTVEVHKTPAILAFEDVQPEIEFRKRSVDSSLARGLDRQPKGLGFDSTEKKKKNLFLLLPSRFFSGGFFGASRLATAHPTFHRVK